jgi:hypothetical protein
MWIREPWAGDILHVARNMREMDAREILDVRPERDPDLLAAGFAANRERMRVCYVAGLDTSRVATAVVAVWSSDATPWLAEAAMFATPDFPLLARALVRHIRRDTAPQILATGISRMEARALAAHADSRRFLRACGAIEETLLPDYGRRREPYVLCAWRRSDWEKPDVLEHSETRPSDL